MSCHLSSPWVQPLATCISSRYVGPALPTISCRCSPPFQRQLDIIIPSDWAATRTEATPAACTVSLLSSFWQTHCEKWPCIVRRGSLMWYKWRWWKVKMKGQVLAIFQPTFTAGTCEASRFEIHSIRIRIGCPIRFDSKGMTRFENFRFFSNRTCLLLCSL